jgi:DNA-binding MarR family transcriptional regulator
MESSLLALIDTLDAAFRRWQREVGVEEGLGELTLRQLRYLEAIGQIGSPSVTALAKRLGVSKAAVTLGVRRLEALGYVRKSRSEVDRRVVHLQLTAASETLVRAKGETLRRTVVAMREALSNDEALNLERLLDKLVRRLRIDEAKGDTER